MTVATDPHPNLVHARGHALAVRHPIVVSFAPGGTWRWCYADEAYV